MMDIDTLIERIPMETWNACVWQGNSNRCGCLDPDDARKIIAAVLEHVNADSIQDESSDMSRVSDAAEVLNHTSVGLLSALRTLGGQYGPGGVLQVVKVMHTIPGSWDVMQNDRISMNDPGYYPQSDSTFVDNLRHLINVHSKENDSDTPDFVLAEFLAKQLDVLAATLQVRDVWYVNSSPPRSKGPKTNDVLEAFANPAPWPPSQPAVAPDEHLEAQCEDIANGQGF